MQAGGTIELEVAPGDGGVRLDRWLAEHAGGLSRSRLQALIADGRITGPGGKPIDSAARKVQPGERYVIDVPPPVPARPEAEAIPLDILYEDADLIVLDKPVGLVVHPAPGHHGGTLVNALLEHCKGSLSGIGGVTRPGIVHRLDKDTSGIMVCAKSDLAHRGLVEQFQVHSIARAYFAVVWGRPSPPKGRIETLIGRDPHDRKRMAVVGRGGKPAITEYKTLRPVGSDAALVDCRLLTGRTHQIRVHMQSIGHALVGDPVYRRRADRRRSSASVIQSGSVAYKKQALQAHTLGFVHPATGKEMHFEIELSNDLKDLIDALDQF